MKLGDVMDELAVRLDMINGLRVFAQPTGSITPPAAMVDFPEEYTYDATYGRGMDTMSLPVVVAVGRPTDRSTRDAITKYVDGAGPDSVKVVLETGSYQSFDEVMVKSVDFDVHEIGATPYLVAVFNCDIAGSGNG